MKIVKPATATFWLGIAWIALVAPVIAASDDVHLAYVASYRGWLSMGLRLDITSVALTLPALTHVTPSPEVALLAFTTEPFRKVEPVLPMRFCYRSEFIPDRFITQAVDWWSRMGSKASRGRLEFDRQSHRVLRRHVERKLTGQGATQYAVEQRLNASAWASAADPDLSEAAFPAGAPPMDRLALLQWLRHQSLAMGTILEVPVSDGHHLLGFHIEVEGEEPLQWQGHAQASWRIRLQPQFNDASDNRPTWVWLSEDAQRLPLLFRSERIFGHFEVRLEAVTPTMPTCAVPEAAALALPNAPVATTSSP
jgi:hypothetical protein